MSDPPTPPFRDRAHAGRLLAGPVAASGLDGPLVVGLARGGVPVAAALAGALEGASVDVVVARKVTAPDRPEAGLGAVAGERATVWSDAALAAQGLSPADLSDAVAEAREEALRRERAYGAGWPSRVPGRDVVLGDDGVATGVTARAAARALRAAGPARLVVAAPVAAPMGATAIAEELAGVPGGTAFACTPGAFGAVSSWYERFDQLADGDVLALLG